MRPEPDPMFFSMRRVTLCDGKNTCTRAKWITERLQTHVLQLTSEAIGPSAGIAGVLWCSKRCSRISKRVCCNKISVMGKNEGEKFGMEGEKFGVKGEKFGMEGEKFGVKGFEPSLAVENLKYCL